LFIPSGLTDEMQILDRYVFDGLKVYDRRMDRNHAAAFEQTNKHMAIALLVQAREAVNTTVFECRHLLNLIMEFGSIIGERPQFIVRVFHALWAKRRLRVL
jgi:hypothetical protein